MEKNFSYYFVLFIINLFENKKAKIDILSYFCG